MRSPDKSLFALASQGGAALSSRATRSCHRINNGAPITSRAVKAMNGVGGTARNNMERHRPTPPRKIMPQITRNRRVCFSIRGISQKSRDHDRKQKIKGGKAHGNRSEKRIAAKETHRTERNPTTDERRLTQMESPSVSSIPMWRYWFVDGSVSSGATCETIL